MTDRAIHALFDRLSGTLPVYVSRVPAIQISFVVTCVVFVAGLHNVNQDRQHHKASPNTVRRFRWIVLLGILVIVCSSIQEIVADKVYMALSIRKNAQHFANVWWLAKYCDALSNMRS